MRGQPSHIRGVVRLILQGLRGSTGVPAARGPVPGRRLAVERHGLLAPARSVESFLRVTEGARIAAFSGPDAVLPPTYPARWETALALELLALAGARLPTAGLIHLGGETVQVRPMRAGERFRCRVELERVESDARGTRLTLASRNWTAAGQLCIESSLSLLIRGGDPGGAARPSAAEAEPPGPWREVAGWTLAASHGRRYARVSGDFNPIHLWSWSARLLGFRRPILHGFCTEAMVAHALIEHLLAGDPAALRRLRIGFRAPLALPARVRLLVAGAEQGGGGRFRVVDENGGPRPLAEGEFVGAA